MGDEIAALWQVWQHAGGTWAQFWAAAKMPDNVYAQTTGRQDRLWKELRRGELPPLLVLGVNPYMLVMLAQVYATQQGALPQNRGRLFAAFVATLLRREEKRCDTALWPGAQPLRTALAELAYAMQSAGERGKNGEQSGNLFEVIAGKSILSFRRDDHEGAPPSSKCFALVRSVDKKPKRRLFELLQAQGMQANQRVTFFSDGGDTVRMLPEYLHPAAEQILDWFHLTMRITVLQQCARGLEQQWSARVAHDPQGESLERRLESVKHYLGHGNAGNALQQLRWLAEDLDGWDYDEEGEPKRQGGSEGAARMLKYVQELETYISNNANYIVNYGERYRNGDRISTGFAELTINQVISKRMVKKQQMQWTPEGAHLLLQVRTAVINEDWQDTFRTWYPQFRLVVASDEESREAA